MKKYLSIMTAIFLACSVRALPICTNVYDTIHASVCSGHSYSFNGQSLSVQSIYSDTVVLAGGCDSITVLYLNISPVPQAMISATGLGCAGRDTISLNWASGSFSVAWYRDSTLVYAQSAAQTIQTVAGGHGPGLGPTNLLSPSDIFVDRAGYLYVADASSHRVRRFPPGSTSDSSGATIAGLAANGGSAADQLYEPSAVVADSAGNVYVTDRGNNRIQRFPAGSTSGTMGVTVAGGNGFGFGANQLHGPSNIYLDTDGSIYVADENNSRIQKFPPGSTSASNAVTVAGSLSSGSAANQLNFVAAVGLDGQKNIYAGDYFNSRIQKFPAGSTSGSNAVTVALGNMAGTGQNQVTNLGHIFVDRAGNVYVADVYTNGRILKFPAGSTSATYGINVAGGYGEGDAYNQLKNPNGVFVDSAGNIYVADSDNDRIQKFWPMALPAYVPAAAGSYRAILTTSMGCMDTTNTIQINAIQTPSVYISASHLSILSGVSDTFTATPVYGGATPVYQWYQNGLAVGTNSPVYVTSFSSADSVWCLMRSSACTSPDSAVSNRLHITLACRNTYDTIHASFCAGSTYSFAGQSLSHAGTYADTLVAASGCDSIIILTLSAIPPILTSASQTICLGSSYDFHGHLLAQAGIYYDTLTAVNGCDSICELYLSVLNDSIHAHFTLQPSPTPHLWYLLNQCTGSNPLTYIWNWGDGSPASTGDTPSHTYANAGFYSICVDASDSRGCSAGFCDSNAYVYKTEAGQIVQINVVRTIPNGLNTLSDSYLSIEPNPNRGSFTLETSGLGGIAQYTVYDMLGKVIAQNNIHKDREQITLGAASGIYTLVVHSGEDMKAVRLIVE